MKRYIVALSHDAVRLHWQFARMIADLPGMTPAARARASEYARQWHNIASGQHPPPPTFSDDRDTIAVAELADFYPPVSPAPEEITVHYTTRQGLELKGPAPTQFSAADMYGLARQIREAGRPMPRGMGAWLADAEIGDEAAFYDRKTDTLARVRKRAIGTADSSTKSAGAASR